MLQRFMRDIRGNFAVISAIMAVPLLMSIGLYLDYARQSSARVHLQSLADAAALRVAISRQTVQSQMEATAREAIEADLDRNTVDSVQLESLISSANSVQVQLKAEVDTTFMQFGNIMEVGVRAQATAERAASGNVELALILDNTYSMKSPDSSGREKMETLKIAARQLVDEVMKNGSTNIKVGVVPYAEYVNVGKSSAPANWLTVAPTVQRPDYCYIPMTYQCLRQEVGPCYSVDDGIRTERSCGCAEYAPGVPTGPQVCEPVAPLTWWGCVNSRPDGDYRLNDKDSTSHKYYGFADTSRTCPTPITALTSTKQTIVNAINALEYSNPYTGSRPLTMIPAGLIWGQNILSATVPYNQGAAYDPANKNPRKVAVLMTDGDNTMYMRPDGSHGFIGENLAAWDPETESPPALAAERRDRTDADTLSICNYMKTNRIEVYTVAFMVASQRARDILEQCATTPANYYNAANADALAQSFQSISESLTSVRLSR